jgi:FkbM family methyltransferase
LAEKVRDLIDLRAALRGGIVYFAVNQHVTSPADLAESPADLAESPADLAESPADLAESPADLAESPADLAELALPEPRPASNGILPPNIPVYRRIGRRCLRLIRPLALPFVTRLQRQVSWGVEASLSAQVLRDVLSSQQAINAEQYSINAQIRTMSDALEALKDTIVQTRDLASPIRTMSDTLEALKDTVAQTRDLALPTGGLLEGLTQSVDKTRELSAAAVEYSSTLLQARAVPLGDEVLARSPFGWLLLPSEDLPLIVHMLETRGSPEPGTVAVAQAILEPNDLAIDVGANVGSLAVAMARSVAPHGRVLAIEPTPRTAKLLRRTCAILGLEQIIQVEECAVGAKDGTAKLAIGVTSGHNSLLPLDEATNSVEVLVRPLDALVSSGSRPALVKIDAEGFELEVWRGMERLVRDTPNLAVIVEFGPSHLLRSGVTIETWFELLMAPGFTPWEIDEVSGTIRPLRSSGLQDVFSINLLLLRDSPSRWPRLRIAT